jgi:dynein heavy chain
LYAVIWSIGCTGDYNGREKFNVYLKDLMKEAPPKDVFPFEDNEGATIYDFEWNMEDKIW